MTRRITALILALALLCGAAVAEYALSYDGTVIAGETISVNAPFGGKVSGMTVRKGSLVTKGTALAEISTKLNYAPLEGTVTGVYAAEGDDLAGITTRYGAVMYIEPTNRYSINASTEKAYNASENKYIHLGERVYLSCTADGTHKGTGMVSGLTDTGYTVEVTGGEFYMEETVGIYRQADYAATSRIGRGEVTRTKPVAVSAEGSLLKLHVKNGDFVERGELLFETVDGVLDGSFAVNGKLTAPAGGVIASVEAANGASVAKGDCVVKLYPTDSLLIEVNVPEEDLHELFEGEKASIEFRWDINETAIKTGRVESISYLSESEGSSGKTMFKMYISFEADAMVRIGMNATVYLTGEKYADETPANEEKTDD